MENCIKVSMRKTVETTYKNAVVSPISIHLMLNMVASGACGSTLEDMLGFLGATSVQDLNLKSLQFMNVVQETPPATCGGPTLSSLNTLWIDDQFPLKPSYRKTLREIYHAMAKTAHFRYEHEDARAVANLWAENATKGLVKHFHPPDSITNDTVLILANALYFKGVLENGFNLSDTTTKNFYLLSPNKVRVPFLTKENTPHFFGMYEKYKLLKLPYQKGQDTRQFSMFIYLPNDRHGLTFLLLDFMNDPKLFHQQNDLKRVNLSKLMIPKFKFSSDFSARRWIERMWLSSPFYDSTAELSEMVDLRNAAGSVHVSDIFHKAYIEMNEDGAEAAAGAAGLAPKVGGPLVPMTRQSPTFVANHPFMFMIKEEVSGTICLIGAIYDPTVED